VFDVGFDDSGLPAEPADLEAHRGFISDRHAGKGEKRRLRRGFECKEIGTTKIMKRKIVIATLSVVLVLIVLGGVKALQIRKLVTTPPPPQLESVSSAIAKQEKWQRTLSAIGSVTAVQGINVTTELAGTVKEIAFESGAQVAKDDLLVRLDTSSEEAQLRAAEAQTEWTRISAERARKLRADDTVSQSELDSAEAGLKQAQANADTIRATIAKKTIRAPFAGRLGIRIINLGEYLDTGKPVVSLQSLSPIHADFSLPQRALAQLSAGMRVRLTIDTFPDRPFDGMLNAINPDLDPSTRSVRLQATFDNPDQVLRPGMFARLEVLLPSEENVLVIPATSVLSAPYGSSVYIIEPSTNAAGGLVVRQQLIRTGRARGDFVSVETGLKAGEKVAGSGLFKLRNGMSVTENNEWVPKSAENPHPPDA
jgi:membrane fusion protein (multidrug efflux system)